MTKKLNVDAITNELAESAFFRRPQREQLEIDKHTPLPEKPIIQEEPRSRLPRPGLTHYYHIDHLEKSL